MSARLARFEVVRSDAGWHARFRAANGRIVWVTETYERAARADRAIGLVTGSHIHTSNGSPATVFVGSQRLEVRTVDEREVAR